MKIHEIKNLPHEYTIDKELLILLSEANASYGEYKAYLKSFTFDPKFFLNSIILNESLKSTQIEGTQISQDDVFYLKYMPKTDDNLEIQNLKKVIEYSKTFLTKSNKIDSLFLNGAHKILLDSARGNEKNPGKIRDIQNWIGPKGCDINEAIYIPPKPEKVPILLENLLTYMSDKFIDPVFINVAISHSQFESIHPYRDGNGRLGRALMSIHLASLTDDEPILFLSEVIDLYKPTYYKLLNESREGNMLGFIKFTLQCIIEQCYNYVSKINMIKKIYNQDLETVKVLKSNAIYRIMPAMMHQIVFTNKELSNETGVSRNTIAYLLERLLELNIIVEDSSYAKKAYRYKNIYDVFVGK